MPIKANEVAGIVYKMLVDAVEDEYKGSTAEEKEQALYRILVAMASH